MEMFLMVLAMSLVGVVVSGVLFSAATRGADPETTVTLRAPARKSAAMGRPLPAEGGRFFAGPPPSTPAGGIEVLLLQIEQHVRLEQAAAEAFLHAPTRESLHCRTVSPLVH